MSDLALLREGYGVCLDEREVERREWIDSLAYVLYESGSDRVRQLLHELSAFASQSGVAGATVGLTTPYINTIPAVATPAYPGNVELEQRLEAYMRWNAMAMVVAGNKRSDGIGGHISTYQSVATLFEVGLNHFFRARSAEHPGDLVFFQGHASPGLYARAFLEGRLSGEQLANFRRELQPGGGLSSYPHPWLMPSFWQFPTVSMGLGPIMAIYQARFIKYLENRGLRPATDQHVWAFLGDGEMDEPESLGAISIAARENLGNLTFVVNCNLQRLDGPVRGNGKIVQELEGIFRGAGWNVVKVLWASEWDELFERDEFGLLRQRLTELVDGWIQMHAIEGGAYIREHLFGASEELKALVANLSDEQIKGLRRGGHDHAKVYAAYQAAMASTNQPTVILAQTVKGYGMGKGGEAQNIAHQQKKLSGDQVQAFAQRFELALDPSTLDSLDFVKPAEDSPEMAYLRERRAALGGPMPARIVDYPRLAPVPDELIAEFEAGTEGREASTTMVFVRVLSKLLKDKTLGPRVVPIIPDEARTFGMESLFREVGIYSPHGQQYEPVDAKSLLYYKESTSGQILEEGINEAGAMSDFIAAGMSYATHGVPMIPFYTYYSMFGFQRVGDLIWAAADSRVRGFLMGATAGRTTLNGEGLQHEDGHSQLWAYAVPNLKSYDPSFAYELATIVQAGVREMQLEDRDVLYYLTISNENYAQPPMPQGEGYAERETLREQILRGMHLFRRSEREEGTPRVALLGSGPIMPQVQRAAAALESRWGLAADIFAVSSYQQLYRDGVDTEREHLLDPLGATRTAFVTEMLRPRHEGGVIVAASDYMKTLPESISRWIPGTLVSLGTDGFGRSESREALRDFFEVDDRYIQWAALVGLVRQGKLDASILRDAREELSIPAEKPNPAYA